MRRRVGWLLAAVIAVATAATVVWAVTADEPPPAGPAAGAATILPAPAELVATPGVRVTIPPGAPITVSSPELADLGRYLADIIGGSAPTVGTDRPARGIALLLDAAVSGAEAYELRVDADGAVIRAATAAGLFRGVQTVRQLLPLEAPLELPGVLIRDEPRFAHRGVMLDVARHFFDVADVERLIDLAAMQKLNYLHLHLTDDQGWRIAIDGWPRLTDYGGGTEVGGGTGGYYTQDDYRAIVAYAASRFITVIPEVDLPGHTNAALASYPQLTCDGVAPPRYTGIEVGFSALCPDRDETYRFLDDVFGQLAALTPGPYLHLGGDEARAMSDTDYAAVVTRAQAIVANHGKVALGWHDIAAAELPASTVLQYWGRSGEHFDAGGHGVVMSPADRAYLDQKYDSGTRIGLTWAGPTSIEEAYDWDPATGGPTVLGVEAPLWTETVTTMDDIEYLAFPRLAAIAELGWSPASTHDWPAFRQRLGAQAPRWTALGIDFARVDGVPWAD